MRYDKQIKKTEKIQQEFSDIQAKFERLNKNYDHLKSVVEGLMHESRRFSAAITSYSEELSRLSDHKSDSRIKELAETIFYTSGLLSSRMAFSDYELNPRSISRQTYLRTGIYKKFDKARYILGKQAREKSLRVNFIGKSTLEIDALQAFELIPFVLLENAIKYSPSSQDVTISFEEDRNKELEVAISSTGPKLSDDEHKSLFVRGMRGDGAIQSSVPGEGLGLYLAKTLCDLHKIRISVERPLGTSYTLNTVSYVPFVVRLVVKR